jgi:transcriptional regulator with XRE-family HTH domain
MAQWHIKLAALLEARGMTQVELGRRLKVSTRTVVRWLNDPPQGEPSVTQCLKLATEFGVTLDQLFDPRVPLPERGSFVIQSVPAQAIAAETARAITRASRRRASPRPPRRRGAGKGE